MEREILYRKTLFPLLLAAAMAATILPARAESPTPADPAQWSAADLKKYERLEFGFDLEARKRIFADSTAEGSQAIIASSSNPLATHAGLLILKNGGSAADAVIATSLAQVALTAGATISYAGIWSALYYDARTGKVESLNAGYNTVKGETDPLTIPKRGEPSGRSALVPGFMAGVQAMHDRYGTLPFADLFAPAIWVADHGVAFNPAHLGRFNAASQSLSRLPETRRVFTNASGEPYKLNEIFRQPELAETLRKVAKHGSAYMYTGDWARRFVEAVRREGGKMTMEDLAAYRATWSNAASVPYAGFQVASMGDGHYGARVTLGSLQVADELGVPELPHYTKSAEALYYLVQTSRIESNLVYTTPKVQADLVGADLASKPDFQLRPETAAKIAARIRQMMKAVPSEEPLPAHSSCIVAVDQQGNVAVVLHSINTVLWGTTGLFVDGVSIPDSASIQQRPILTAGPGARLPETTNPVIVLKEGKPVLGTVAIGSGLHQAMLQNLVSVLNFGIDPRESVDMPNTHGPSLNVAAGAEAKAEREKEVITDGEFDPAVIAGLHARGQLTKALRPSGQDGYWIGVQIQGTPRDKERKLIGAATKKQPSLVEAY